MPRLLLLANLRHFRRHRWLPLLTLVGIVLGVAVVAGVELTNQSARDNFRLANDQLLGRTTHLIRADGMLPESLLVALNTELGVAATPLIHRYLRLGDDRGPLLQLLGIDPFQLQRFRPRRPLRLAGDAGVADLMLQPDTALLGGVTAARAGLVAGDALTVVTPRGPRRLRLLGLFGDDGDVRQARLLLMDIGRAQALLGLEGRLDAIQLRLEGDQPRRLQAWLPPGYRLEPVTEARAATEGLGRALQLNLSALGGLAMVVGLFLVYNGFAFSLVQRQGLFARLRTLGVSRRELGGYLLLELLAFALLGALLGLGLGGLLAERLLVLVTRTLNDLYVTSPIQQLHWSPQALGRSLAVGVGGTLLAGLGPARAALGRLLAASQNRPALERRAGARGRGLGWAALGLAALAQALIAADSGLAGGFAAVTALLLACACLVPAALVGLCRGLEALWGRWAPRGWLVTLALRDSRRALSRTGIALMALMLAVSATVGMGIMIDSFRTTLSQWLTQRLNADLYVAPQTSLPDPDGGLAPEVWRWLEAQPSVADIARRRRLEARVGGVQVELFAARLPPAARRGYRFADGDGAAAWAGFERGEALISEPLANRRHLRRGDRMVVERAAGALPLRVAGVYYDYGHDQGRILLDQATAARHWGDRPGRVAGLYLRPGVSAAALAERLQARFPTLRVTETRGVLARSLAVFERTFRVTEVLRLLAVLVAFVGLFAALLALQLERQPELRLYHGLGFSPGERVRLLFYQALLLGLAAGLWAIPTGLLLAWALIDVIQLRAFGWTLLFEPDPAVLLQAPLLALAAALLASLYPAWRQLRGAGPRLRWVD